MNHKQLRVTLHRTYETGMVPFVWGRPGIGKSSAIKEFAEELKIGFTDLRLSQLDMADLRGLPKLEGERVKWLPPEFLPKDGAGVLFLDEMNLASPSVQSSAYQLILDRKLGSYTLPKDWMIVAAGNTVDDRANVFDMPAPLANRFVHITLDVPDIKEWTDWASAHAIDPRVIAFLNYKPSNMFRFDSKGLEKAWPSPRSWAFASALIRGLQSTEDVRFYAQQAVGSLGIEFAAFVKVGENLNVDKFLKDPKTIKDVRAIDQLYLVCAGLAEKYGMKEGGVYYLEKIMDVVLEMDKPEFAAILMRMTRAVNKDHFDSTHRKTKQWREYEKRYSHLYNKDL